jgi:hypothetical protein
MAAFMGAHVIIGSENADADRALLRDALGLNSVDVGGGWLIFRLPPAEVAGASRKERPASALPDVHEP